MITSPLPAEFPPVVPTANDHVALPDITPEGTIGSLQLLSTQAQGLIGITGAPLLRPVLGDVTLSRPAVDRVDHWIPRFTWRAGGLTLVEAILAPIGHRGIVIRLELENAGRAAVQTPVGLEASWDRTTFTLFSSRVLPVSQSVRADPWTRSLVMEALGALPIAAWAVHPDPHVPLPEPAPDAASRTTFRLAPEVALEPGERAAVTFYVGVAREADGARTTAVDLRRRGWERLLAETQAWLRQRLVAGGGALADLFHHNLLFNRFFACGRTIDTDDFVWVTSRSPRYYVSAAFWSRDAFLWSLPGLLLADRQAAREALVYACRTQWRHAGMHAQYLGGTVIYPGFELDEFAAFAVGLGNYLRATNDLSIVHEEGVTDVALDFADRLAGHLGTHGLYATFLDPSDDPVRYPYLTYDNVLVWRGLLDIADVCHRLGWTPEERRARDLASALHAAIRRTCIVDGLHGSMFAWAVDGEGNYQLYDAPPGSLTLLTHYGFCDPDDPAYLATTAWIRSSENPWYVPGRFTAPASAHSPDPWPMAIVNDLLCGRAEGLAWLERAEMDGGLACETVDRESGRVRSGGAFATFAGLLAAGLFHHRDRWRP